MPDLDLAMWNTSPLLSGWARIQVIAVMCHPDRLDWRHQYLAVAAAKVIEATQDPATKAAIEEACLQPIGGLKAMIDAPRDGQIQDRLEKYGYRFGWTAGMMLLLMLSLEL